jgi:hypothetical protein
MSTVPPQPLSISRAQKISMFVGAALFGSWAAVVFTLVITSSAIRPVRENAAFLAVFGWTVLCHLVVAMVFGAWLGGLVSFVWRSQPGRQIFWRLSGGALGIMLASAGTGALSTDTRWLPLPRGSGGLAEPFVIGCVGLTGMLLGLLIGHAIAWVTRDTIRELP